MAKITSYEGKIPKRIDDFVIYLLGDDLIIRQNSGFTSKGVMQEAKYVLCRQNASEFGLVSKTCKAIRVVVADGLTRHNNLEVVNNFTKMMRSLLVYDAEHERGSRTLKSALATLEAQERLKGYVFTPDFKLQLQKVNHRLDVSIPDVFFARRNVYLGFSVQYLYFDFDTLTGYLESTNWQMELLDKTISFLLPDGLPDGYLFPLYRFSFFLKQEDGSFLPILPDEKGLVVGQLAVGV